MRGWHIAPALHDVVDVDHAGGPTVVLPTLRIVAVHHVAHRPSGTLLAGWDWSPTGILTRPGGWPTGPRALTVDLTHGHDEAPAELVGLIAELAAATRSATPGLRSESRSVGGITTARSYLDTGAVAATLAAFEHVLVRHRVGVPT